MVERKSGAVSRHLDTLFSIGVTREMTDGQLLERFSTGSGRAAELAFEALVERHGPMVLRVCRAQLSESEETDDAFQATFLILVKKARSLWVRDSLGPWLHQVAFRTAACARLSAARRRKHERLAAENASIMVGRESHRPADWEYLLHEEIDRLPERYRVPIIRCDLQGCSCEEVARQMGCAVGTVKSWRSRGRARLRERLIHRGIAPSAAVSIVLAQDIARAAVSERTIRLVSHALQSGTTAEGVSASVKLLVKGVLKTMLLSKLQTAATAVLAVGFLTGTFGAFAWVVADDSPKPVKPVEQARPAPPAVIVKPHPATDPSKDPLEKWSLTLAEAIRIGLDNADEIRLISMGTPSRIAPVRPDVDPQDFRDEVMAKVRSIEQQYYSLVQVHVQNWAAEQAVEIGKEILKREQAKLAAGKGTIADVAEAEQRLEQFNLDLTTRISDLFTTERQLRNILGLPPTDNRRIIPTSSLTEALIKPDWDSALATMRKNHPKLLKAEARVHEAEVASNGSKDNQLDILQSRKDFSKQALHNTTHALARFFLEIDANFKQFKTASRLKTAASTRLQAQRSDYEEGRVTVDRCLDAVSQYCTAVASEAQYRTTYNISITALEEAKGTLLDFDKIVVVDSPLSPSYAKLTPNPPTVSVASAPLNPAYVATVAPAHIPPAPINPGSKPEPTKLDPAVSKTVSFDLTLGTGPSPLRIRGSFSITPADSAGATKTP